VRLTIGGSMLLPGTDVSSERVKGGLEEQHSINKAQLHRAGPPGFFRWPQRGVMQAVQGVRV